jgi:hypothetical protein
MQIADLAGLGISGILSVVTIANWAFHVVPPPFIRVTKLRQRIVLRKKCDVEFSDYLE